MKYHKWKQIQNTKGTNYQECKKCEIIRSYQLGRWVFTFRGVVIKNEGCKKYLDNETI